MQEYIKYMIVEKLSWNYNITSIFILLEYYKKLSRLILFTRKLKIIKKIL
jgi:hypothetical protein